MKTFVVLSLDTRRPKRDGTFPVLLRISHFGKVSSITTGIYVKDADWDEKARAVRASYKGTQSVARLNNFLQKMKSEAIDIVTRLDEKKVLGTLSAVQVKQLVERKSESGSFLRFGEELASEFDEAGRYGSAQAYRITLRVLSNFCRGGNPSFRDITYSFLSKLEQYHLQKGGALNGLAVYMRTVRAIFNEAIRRGLAEQDAYPFKSYTIKTTKTRKRAISMEAIKRIQSLALAPGHPLYHARNYFLSSFYLRGVPFADLVRLKVGDIVDGRIRYDRQKTDKPYDIAVVPAMQEILALYIEGRSSEDYIFPVLTAREADREYRQVNDARKRYNRKLKEIAKLCGIEESLTSYVSRHSFATQAKNLGVPIAAISDMLGHSDTKTTQVYLDSLPSDIMDDFHKRILGDL
ncbi:MAG: site-specific integrase [Bacteroidetes bacterium]|nr:site-specific integrase [Bacteroidota bacterium]